MWNGTCESTPPATGMWRAAWLGPAGGGHRLLQILTGPSGWALFPRLFISVRPQPATRGDPREDECAAAVICGSLYVQLTRQSANRTARLRA